MSRTKPDRFERLALKARCYTCEAMVTEWCLNLRGRPTADLHASRGRHLLEAYWQGYDDGKRGLAR